MKEKETKEERIARLTKHTYRHTLKMLFIFSIPAIIGAIIGSFIDKEFDIKPYGTIGILIIFFFASWIYALKVITEIKSMTKNDKEKKK